MTKKMPRLKRPLYWMDIGGEEFIHTMVMNAFPNIDSKGKE